MPAARKDLRGRRAVFVIRVRGSCSKNEHDFREPIKRTLDDAQNLPCVSQEASGLSLWVFSATCSRHYISVTDSAKCDQVDSAPELLACRFRLTAIFPA
jgi:hypothetical protein